MAAIPYVAVTVTSPFDLAKYGTTVIAPPNKSGRSLYKVEADWNLQAIIPPAKTRVDALTELRKVATGPKAQDAKPLTHDEKQSRIWRMKITALYTELYDKPDICNDATFWNQLREAILNPQ